MRRHYSIKVFYSEEDRTPKSLHQELLERAKEEGVSLNQLIVYLLSAGLKKRAA